MRILQKSLLAICACLALANCTQATEQTVSRADRNPSPEVQNMIGAEDRSCLAEAIYFEAGGTAEGRAAVAHVILNRAEDGRFPRSVCGVVRDGCQFSYRCSGRSLSLVDPTKRTGALKTAEAVLQGAPDPTGGALFFHAAGIKPGWFSTRPRVGTFGGNVFYR